MPKVLKQLAKQSLLLGTAVSVSTLSMGRVEAQERVAQVQEPGTDSPPPSSATPGSGTAASPAGVSSATPAPSPIPLPTPQELQQRRTSLDIQSTRPDTVVERRVSLIDSKGAFVVLPLRTVNETWEQVCVTPCRIDADKFSAYRISSQNGVTPTGPFTIPQNGDNVALKVDAGNLGAHRLGAALALMGTVAAVVGASLLVAAPRVVNEDNERDTRTAGFITGGAGIGLLGIGIPLAILTRSRVFDGGTQVSGRPH